MIAFHHLTATHSKILGVFLLILKAGKRRSEIGCYGVVAFDLRANLFGECRSEIGSYGVVAFDLCDFSCKVESQKVCVCLQTRIPSETIASFSNLGRHGDLPYDNRRICRVLVRLRQSRTYFTIVIFFTSVLSGEDIR